MTDKENKNVNRLPLISLNSIHKHGARNMFIGGCLMAIGEICAQSIGFHLSHDFDLFKKISNYKKEVNKNDVMNNNKCDKTRLTVVEHIDWLKVLRLGGIGIFQGLYQHYYYTWLDRYLVGTSAKTVLKKIVLDELVMSPITLSLFLVINGTIESHGLAGGFERLRTLFLPGYLTDLLVWPAVQAFNFAYVHTKYRVIYVSFFTSIWNTYLCLLCFRKNQNPVEVLPLKSE